MEISACPRCGSQALHVPTLADGGVLGYSTMASVVCSACAFQGSPIVFRDRAAYEQFLAGLSGQDADGGAAAEDEDLTEEERGLLDDIAASPTRYRRPWATVAFIWFIGGTFLVLTPIGVFVVYGAQPGMPSVVVPGVFAMVLDALEAWAFFRIASRMWVKAQLG